MRQKKPIKLIDGEMVIYVAGGLVDSVGVVSGGQIAFLTTPPHTVIDFDIEGADQEQICTGCAYSKDPHARHQYS